MACDSSDPRIQPDAGMDADTDADAHTDADADADADAGPQWDPRYDAFAAALQADLADTLSYGISAAVMEHGEVTFSAAFGSRDLAGTLPLTPDTLMQIGSTSKQFTAVALLQKIAAGTISLDDTLEALVPELEFARDPAWDDAITVRHLLTHQGGLADLNESSLSPDDGELAGYATGGYATDGYVRNPPGIFWNYANTNFTFAGLITELADTRAWPDLMREEVFLPVGMVRTFARNADVAADGNFAESFGVGTHSAGFGTTGPVTLEQTVDPAFSRPAGFIWSTPTQMMAWARFLIDGNPAVLPDAWREQLTSPQADTLYLVGNHRYGYGIFVDTGYYSLDGTWFPLTVWAHDGATLSFTHAFIVFPEQGFAVSVSISGINADLSRSVDTAIRTLADLPAPAPAPQYTFDPAVLDQHVGTYREPYDSFDMIITREGDELRIAMPEWSALGVDVNPRMQAISSDLYLISLDGQVFDLTFIPPGADGQSRYVRNRFFVTERVPDGKTAAPRSTLSRERVLRWLRASQSRTTWPPGPRG